MIKKTIFLIITISFFSLHNVFAQQDTISSTVQDKNNDEGFKMYASFTGGFPVKGLPTFDYSFGAYSHFDYNFNEHFAIRLDLGWNDFAGKETEYVDNQGGVHTDIPDMSVWEFTAGLRAKVSYFYLEGRAGYFTGIHEWGYVPAVGVKFWKLDFQVNIIMTKNVQWGGARIGYFF